MRRRPSGRALIACGLLIAALALRVAQVQSTSYRPVNDAGSYLTLASEVARTGDYAARTGAGGTRGPTAYFPPGFPYFLAAVDLLDGHTVPRDGAIQPARLAQAALGTVTVALVGLVALEACSAGVALVALALAALYPVFIELSAILVAENLFTALVLAAVYSMLRARRSTRPYAWIAGAGLLTGLATLTHVNGLVVLAPLLVAGLRVRATVSSVLVLLVTYALVLVPWTLRNESQLHRFIPVSDETGITLVGTYNPASAGNSEVPYKWRLFYGIPGERSLIRRSHRMSEPALSARLQSQALHYIARHPAAPVEVGFYNSLRLLELEGSYAWHASARAMGIPRSTARVGVVAFWILILLALPGVATRAARRAPGWLWFVPALLWLSAVPINAETPRFREPVDPFLVLLAACTLTGAWSRVTSIRRRRSADRAGRLAGAPVA